MYSKLFAAIPMLAAVELGEAAQFEQDPHHESVILVITSHGLCTGTLIASDIVVTARHCVAEGEPKVDCREDNINRMVIPPGEIGIYEQRNGEAIARGAHIVTTDTTNLCGADIAYIVLDRQLTKHKTSAVNTWALVAPGQKLVVAGRGRTKFGTIGDLKIMEETVVSRNETELQTLSTVCPGDSGGPIFDSHGAVLAVTSRGLIKTCGEEADTDSSMLDAHMDLLDQAEELAVGRAVRVSDSFNSRKDNGCY